MGSHFRSAKMALSERSESKGYVSLAQRRHNSPPRPELQRRFAGHAVGGASHPTRCLTAGLYAVPLELSVVHGEAARVDSSRTEWCPLWARNSALVNSLRP